MARLVGIVGSLRGASVNALVARSAAGEVEQLILHDVADLPFYDGDVEDAGPPASVVGLHEAVAVSDGVVFFSPEYNSSFPAVTKNVIDWLSRPPRAIEQKAVTMIVASPGGRAGLGVREHFATTMAHQPVRVFDTLGLGRYGDRIQPDGSLDQASLDDVVAFLERFVEFATTTP